MSKLFNIPRSLVYYKKKLRKNNNILENAVISIFRESKNNYGSRKIYVELKKQNITASRRYTAPIRDLKGNSTIQSQ